MRNIPSFRPHLALPDNIWEEGRVAIAPASRPGAVRSIFRYSRAAAAYLFRGAEAVAERRVNGERRKFCRRIEQDKKKLLNTRAGRERRHYNRRLGDVTTNIEEDA